MRRTSQKLKQKDNGMIPHTCRAIGFVCIDWRLHPAAELFLARRYTTFDCCANAGAIQGFGNKKTAAHFLKQIELSRALHQPKEVVLTMHMDCGAYGGSKAFDNAKDEMAHHTVELRKIGVVVRERFPMLGVTLYILRLSLRGKKWILRPQKVKHT